MLPIAALAAPSYYPVPGDSDAISRQSQLLASRVEERDDNQNNGDIVAASVCNIANAQMPQSKSA